MASRKLMTQENNANASEETMFMKIVRSICAIALFLIFVRASLYLGYKLASQSAEPADWIAVPMGLMALYLSYMFFRTVFRGRSGSAEKR